MEVLIFAAGPMPKEITPDSLPEGIVLCADGGALHARKLGLKPQLVLGDFDSLNTMTVEELAAAGAMIEKYPVMKDKTDFELLLDKAMDLNPGKIHIWGAFGGRWDHTLANLQALEACAGKGFYCQAYAPGAQLVFARGPRDVVITDRQGETLSLLALSPQVEGVSLYGFFYPLEGATLKKGDSLGISNVIETSPATITFRKGILLAVLSQLKHEYILL